MKYNYIEKSLNTLLIHLHGTGGDEESLINLVEYIDPEASLLGIRGNVVESGMNRFFKRIKPGVFDEENLLFETENLKKFIDDFLNKNNYKKVVVIGYSNGANILGSLQFNYGRIFDGSILMHPMVPLKNFSIKNQGNQKVLITAGKNDLMVNEAEADELFELLKKNNASVEIHKYLSGHNISNKEVEDIKIWYNKL